MVDQNQLRGTRWAPTSYKWNYNPISGLNYNPYKWSYNPYKLVRVGAHFVPIVTRVVQVVAGEFCVENSLPFLEESHFVHRRAKRGQDYNLKIHEQNEPQGSIQL